MNIDTEKIRIPANLVLIKLDPDFDTYHNTDTGNNTGIHVAPWGINQASHVSVTGTVVCTPERLNYEGYALAIKKRNTTRPDGTRGERDQKEIADQRMQSVSYDVPMEVKKDMRVYFEYTTRLNAFKEGRAFENEDGGKYILIPYDLLIMAFRPGTSFDDVQVRDVYMLNGFVLIKPLEYATEKGSDGIKGVKTESDIFIPVQPDAKYVKKGNLWFANVLSAGVHVKSYADFPGAGRDGQLIGNPGQKICYDSRQQKRLEVPHHRVIFKKHELYRIHRKDILMWYPDGNISGLPKV